MAAYLIPLEYVCELTDWTLHFIDQGESVEDAHEQACAAVTAVYLRDEAPVVGQARDERAAGFVARPPTAEHRQLGLPPFRWADVVKLPPTRNAAGAFEGQRAVNNEPRANSPRDIGGAQGGWRAA